MTSLSVPLKRVKRKIKSCQNPLFEKWLKEWKADATKNGSEFRHGLSRALKSLQKFPVRLNSGKECIMLENFGAKICDMLDKKLEEYKALHPEEFKLHSRKSEGITSNFIQESGSNTSLEIGNTVKNTTRKRKSSEKLSQKNIYKDFETNLDSCEGKSRDYKPAYRSGGYAILMALLQETEENSSGLMSKEEIQKRGQNFCDSSFTRPQAGSHYTAWSSIAVLVKKELVNKQGKPAKYSLTEKGIHLATKLKHAENSSESFNNKPKTNQEVVVDTLSFSKTDYVQKEQNCTFENLKSSFQNVEHKVSNQHLAEEKEPTCPSEVEETVFLLPGTFEIILLVDTQERDDKFQQADNMTMRHLKSRNVNFEIRHLKVGDFIWIAKDSVSGHEVVLPYIVERKRMDDLASSIKDGRFHEQKFRLKQSGVENLIYLVEKYGNENQRLGLPLPTLQQAISNTQVIGNFTVKITNNHDHSMRYLNCMTTQLSNIFKNKTLISCKKADISPANLSDDLIPLMTFKEFNKGSEKNKKFTVRSMLIKHLIQLNGVSVEKAKAIVQKYPTPKALMDALKQPNGEKSLASLTCAGLSRSIGPVTAKQIHMLYTSLNLQ